MPTIKNLLIFLIFCAVNQGTITKQYSHLAKIYEGEASPRNLAEQVSIQRCLTSAGKQGYCVPVRSCAIDTDSNILKILDQLCVTKQGTIGLCCSADLLESQSYYEPQVSTQTANSETNEALKERGCGLTTKEFPKIVQGRAAEPDEWPWMAAIIRQHSPIVHCGAVLITHQHVLTAAHCTYLEDKNNLYVRLGEYDFAVVNETRSREFRILRIVQHIDFDPTTYENDIALLQLDRPTLFNTYIWPACLPPFNENWESWVGVVIGWGTQFFGGPYSKVLMEVSMPIWHRETCQNGIIERINEKHMCAGEKTGGKDSCQGDSGGPLLVQLENKRWVVAGIVSWGIRCGEPNHPGVYTKVNEFTHWITSNL